ncbi:MAG: GNAT family N-acetyltransferase [Clostridia bacterium]|nr:GNAT family N-acetyltransferase [Clostridia bacterium]
MADVRLAHPAEMEAVKQLWSKSFDDSDPYLSWYFDNVSSPENTVVCTTSGKVAASLQLIDYDVNIGDRIYKTYYIAGVCTDKEFRHKGYGTKIMKFAEEEAARRGKDFVFLYPMVVGFYEPIGYKFWFSCYENTILPDDSVQVPCRKATEADLDYIMQTYNAFAKKHSGYVLRSRRDVLRAMQYHELLGGGIYLTENGYFAFEKDKNCMRVNELIGPLDAAKGNFECEKIIVRSKDDFGSGESKPKFLYRVCSDMDESVFKTDGQYVNILY